jgi:hypothetical protein
MFFDLAPGRLVEPLTSRTWRSREIGGRVFARIQSRRAENAAAMLRVAEDLLAGDRYTALKGSDNIQARAPA